ncbi:hypothetical protein ACQ0P8_07140 [Halodesulfovibrio aestuarii]|nr:hypothetical protein [Halodesulfovibrio aestuarii]
MICLRKNHKRAVYYDEEKKQYTKCFTPKLELKLKYWFGLRQYPGLNFAHIANRLNALGLKTPPVITAEKYKIITQEVEAPTLKEYLQETKDPTIEPRLIELVATILNSGIVFFDFHYENFLYKDNEFCVLDLEGYSDSFFTSRGKSGVLYRIEKHLGTHFREEVERRWVNVTLSHKISDIFQKLRGKK